MNLNQLLSSSKVNQLNILQPTILHIIPEFGHNIAHLLQTSGIKMLNCGAVISTSSTTKMGNKTFNARQIFLNTKSQFMGLESSEEKHKPIQVLSTLPKSLKEFKDEKKFIVIDHTLISQATEYIINVTTPKQGTFFLFQQLKNQFLSVKTKFPEFENNVLFLLPGIKPKNSLLDIFQILEVTPQNNLIDLLKVFDKFILANINHNNIDPITFPLVMYNKGYPQIIRPNIKYIEKLYDTISKNENKIEQISTLKSTDSTTEPPTNSLVNDISSNKIIQPTIVDVKNDPIESLEVNQQQLSKILKKYKVKDKVIEDNIKLALDSYLAQSKRQVTAENLEKVILMAINHTIFNTDVIDDEYLHNPASLFAKLEEVNTYSVDINYPKLKGNYAVQPNDIIDLKRVTGLVRHKYEFSDNIHGNIKTLFKALESRPNSPIKIVGFKYEYDDNNLNRTINYQITLKNIAGGYSEPYTVNVKVPALVNDRYFKLNGKNYILSNQQFFIPITKTEPNECRFLTSYAMITMSVVNLKMNISEIDKLIDYIQIHYPELIEKIYIENNKIIGADLKDKYEISYQFRLYENIPFISPSEKLLLDEDSGKWVLSQNETIHELSIGKSEFLYDKLINIIKTINPNESIKKSPKSIPYIQIYISGTKTPFIIYLWQQIGLLNALTKLNIKYEIKPAPASQTDFVQIKLESDNLLYIYPENERQRLIVNGLLTIDFKKYLFSSQNINSPTSIEQLIIDKNGTRSVYNFNLLTANIIDPITKELLEFHNMPTNVIDVCSYEMIDKLLNKKADSLTDLKIYRSRQAEIIFNILYKELMMAHNNYNNELKYNKDAKVFLKEEYVIESLLGVHVHSHGNSVVELAQPYNPIAELKLASKTIKTGPNGVPTKRSFKKEHRSIHPSYYGNLGANATTEYADVGIVNHTTLTPLLSNRYGSYGSKDISKVSGWEIVSLDEALVPFVNELQADRCVLAYTHRAQVTPIINGEPPIVATGAEYLVPQIASSKFIQRAEDDGIVDEVVQDNYVKVSYKNGKVSYVDITPRLATTKRASYLRLGMRTLQKGDKFKVNEPIAWTNSFKDNAYSTGRNLKMALLNYLGFSHEDGYVITDEVAQDYTIESVEEINVIIPLNTKIINLISDKINTSAGQVLLEFGYSGTLDDYIEDYNLLDNDSNESDSAVYDYIGNKIQIKSPGGEISDIRIYINNRNNVDPTIIEIWKKISNDLKQRQKLYSYGKSGQREKISAIDNLDMSQLKTGTHKYRGIEFEGARIVFYIKKNKKLGHGDKLCNRYGGKGIVTKVLSQNEIAHGEFTDKIDIFLSPISVLGRKNLAVVKELYIGKILYNLPIIVAKKAKQNQSVINIRKLILSVYDLLDSTEHKKIFNNISKQINSYNDNQLREVLINNEFNFNIIIEPFVNIPIENIKNVADILNIPLDERVFIPELNTWTKTKVPVGIQYIHSMEQIAEDYESLRSTGGYRAVTGQPLKGRAQMGGQSIGNWDVYSLLAYEVPQILEELMTARSDDFKSKRQMTINILENGQTSMPDDTGDASTKSLYEIHMIGMGLTPK